MNQPAVPIPELGNHTLGTGKLPVDHYVSPEFYEREKEQIFRRCWLLAGRADDLREPGDYFVFNVTPVGASVIVVRGKDGALRAFYNACTHRGARLLDDARGCTRAITCGFHGWVFDPAGKLVDVPGEHLFAALDRSQEGLRPVALDTWGGFVFINLDPTPQWTLREYMLPLDDAFDAYLGGQPWQWSFGWKASFKCNWKLLVDAQIEGYHADQTHRKTIAGAISSTGAPAFLHPGSVGVPCGVGAYYVPTDHGIQTAINLISAKYGATSVYTQPEQRFAAQNTGGAIKDDHPLWIFDNYLYFPNIVIFVQKGQLIVQRTLPASADEAHWEVDFYHTVGAENFGQQFNFEQGRIQIRDVLSEDLYTAEGIHANFKSGAIREVNLNLQEVPIRAFYDQLMAMTAEGGK